MSESAELRRPRSAQDRRYVETGESTVTEFRSRSGSAHSGRASAARPAQPQVLSSYSVTPHAASERRPHDSPPVTAEAGESGVLATLKRTAPLSSALVLLGLGAGIGWAWHTPDVYTAETRLSVGSQELSAQAVPGYVLALQTMTSNYARYVETTDSVRMNLVKSLGASASTITGVDASPIPESNVLRIEVAATKPATAVAAANLIGKNMVREVSTTSSGADSSLKALTDASTAAASADQAEKDAEANLAAVLKDPKAAPAKVDAARTAAVDATSKADVLDVQQQSLASSYQNAMQNTGQPATLSVIRPAAVTQDDGASSMERFGAFGLIAGASLAVGLAFLRDRSGRRRRPHDPAAAVSHDADRSVDESDAFADPHAASR